MGTRRRLSVLVVDDDAPTRDLVDALLTDEGFTVECIASATDALNAIGERQPDVVLLDIMMPELSGFDLMDEIRRSYDVAIVFLSARGGEADRAKGLQLGADDYIVKPFGAAELITKICSAVDRHGS